MRRKSSITVEDSQQITRSKTIPSFVRVMLVIDKVSIVY